MLYCLWQMPEEGQELQPQPQEEIPLFFFFHMERRIRETITISPAETRMVPILSMIIVIIMPPFLLFPCQTHGS